MAQDSDLQDILGGFYFDVLINKDLASYSDLLNGSSFEYDGEEYLILSEDDILAKIG